ncbi:alpha-hemolysin translocation ATP-binding HlyB domain protein, partial [Escherichia coli 89.0511]
DFGILLTVMLF